MTFQNFCRILKTGKEAKRGSTSAPYPTPDKKINGFARVTKMGLSRSGGDYSPPLGAGTGCTAVVVVWKT